MPVPDVSLLAAVSGLPVLLVDELFSVLIVWTWEVEAFFPKNDFPLPDLVDMPLVSGFFFPELEAGALASLFGEIMLCVFVGVVVDG